MAISMKARKYSYFTETQKHQMTCCGAFHESVLGLGIVPALRRIILVQSVCACECQFVCDSVSNCEHDLKFYGAVH